MWTMKYQYVGVMHPGEYEGRLLDGWFKYGAYLQRPVCKECHECLSMRVPVDEWEPNRSQRRVIEKNSDLTVRFATPALCDTERVLLHNRYRRSMVETRGWTPHERTLEEYAEEFVLGPVPMTEITIWEGTMLRAVVLADVERDSVAGVTHFYEPGWKDRSIGLFAMLQTFFLAQHLEKTWVYLGYYVANSPTMAYKLQFRPCELRDWDGTWRRVEK
jgi:arginine-tRNA-protein transferase